MNVARDEHCQPITQGASTRAEIDSALTHSPQWRFDERLNAIVRTFRFANYYETIAFVNALAWIVHREDHHPELIVGYNRCEVRFSTHSVSGVSNNDFICAAKVDAAFEAGTVSA